MSSKLSFFPEKTVNIWGKWRENPLEWGPFNNQPQNKNTLYHVGMEFGSLLDPNPLLKKGLQPGGGFNMFKS